MAIRLLIPGKELRAHFIDRVKYHESKAEAYEKQAREVAALAKPEPYMSGDPTNQLLQSARSHRDKAQYFALLARYVDADSLHEANIHDINGLELGELLA